MHGASVQVIVVLKPGDVSTRVQSETAVHAMVRRLGYSMIPVHPALPRQFVIGVPEAAHAEELLSELRAHPDVDGAYVKPGEELPEGSPPAT